MPKAPSPIRLEAELVKSATLHAEIASRSTAEQIEYWAELGRRISDTLTPEALMALSAGLAVLNIEPLRGEAIEPDSVFSQLERDRARGALADAIDGADLRYQASTAFPGLLEQVAPNGKVTVGQFKNGRFVSHRKRAH